MKQDTKTKFRVVNGNFLLKSLFFETTNADKETVLYTLKDEDHNGFPSLYRLYLEEEDITEYDFANKYLANWKHWLALCDCNWFKEYVDRWRSELHLKISARALKRIKSEAKSDTRDAISANKYLLERGWLPKEDKARGRPSKDEIIKEARKIAEDNILLQEDEKRIELRIIK